MNMFSIPAILISAVVYVLPVIIYRFLIHKKPLEHKKAKWSSICYAVIGIALLCCFFPTALFQTFIVIFFTIVNYFILAGIKENANGQIFLLRSFWFLLYGFLSSGVSLILSIYPASTEKATLVLDFIFHLPFLFLFLYKYTKVKKDIKAKFEQKEKLEKENIDSKTEE